MNNIKDIVEAIDELQRRRTNTLRNNTSSSFNVAPEDISNRLRVLYTMLGQKVESEYALYPDKFNLSPIFISDEDFKLIMKSSFTASKAFENLKILEKETNKKEEKIIICLLSTKEDVTYVIRQRAEEESKEQPIEIEREEIKKKVRKMIL